MLVLLRAGMEKLRTALTGGGGMKEYLLPLLEQGKDTAIKE